MPIFTLKQNTKKFKFPTRSFVLLHISSQNQLQIKVKIDRTTIMENKRFIFIETSENIIYTKNDR